MCVAFFRCGRHRKHKASQAVRMRDEPIYYERNFSGDPFPGEELPHETARRVPHRSRRRKDPGPVSRVWAAIMWAGVILLVFLTAAAAGWYSRLPAFRAAEDQLPPDDCFADGVYVDNIPLAGLTYQQALDRITAGQRGTVSGTLRVTAGEQGWIIPVSRFYDGEKNIRDALDKAFAVGRSVTPAILPEGLSPFEYRRRSAESARNKGAYYYVSPAWRQETVSETAAQIAGDIQKEPVNAQLDTFDFATGTFTFLPEEKGYSIPVSDIETAITKALEDHSGTGAAQDIILTPEEILPGITAYDLMNFFGLVSAAAARLPQEAQDIVTALDGIIVPAGTDISLFNVMLQRLPGSGVSREGLKANLYSSELSRIGDMVYRAASAAGMKIGKHFPDGAGGTSISWPDEDLVLSNGSAYPVFLTVSVGQDPCTLYIYGRIPNH